MKAWKLQECVAHSPGAATCVSLGRKSGRVMVSGGDDRRVKLWAVGKPSSILSLTGHTSSVATTEFSQEEDRVAAGSLSGSVRIWDLEEVKIVRTLSGHTSGITSLDFHPFGNFIVSGSTDTLIKLWDISRKGCINTYRGHSGGVNMVRFSPDGKWVVSGGEDGCVKLWDLSAGRQLAELTGNAGSVTTVVFHPNVLLLATASNHRTVRLYDLEKFTQVAVSGTELAAATLRQIVFHPDGVCLYVATSDYLKIYDYETMTCMETVHVGWRTGGGLDDIAIAPSFNQLVGVSISNCMLSTYVVDIKNCLPFVDCAKDVPCEIESVLGSCRRNQFDTPSDNITSSDFPPTNLFDSTGCGSSGNIMDVKIRKSFRRMADGTSLYPFQEDLTAQGTHIYKLSAEEQCDLNDTADVTELEGSEKIFKPNHTIGRSPVRATAALSIATPSLGNAEPETFSSPETVTIASEPCQQPISPLFQHAHVDLPFTVSHSANRVPQIVAAEEKRPRDFIEACSSAVSSDFLPSLTDKIISTKSDNHNNQIHTMEVLSESDLLTHLRKPHDQFMAIISSRVKCLSTIRVMWTRDNVRTAVETAVMWNEPAVLVDVLSVLSQNNKLWSLELVSVLLPHLQPLIKSKYFTHVETTCQVVHVILKNYAELIRKTLDGPMPPGVDLSREERQKRCQECLRHLLSIRNALTTSEVAARAGQCGRELMVCFQILS